MHNKYSHFQQYALACCKKIILLALCMYGLFASVAFAESATAQAQDSHVISSSDNAVGDIIAIKQIAKQNTAVNDAILNNDAIKSVSNQPALNPNQLQANTANPTENKTNVTPRESTAPTSNYDDLLLNNPVIDQANILSQTEKTQLEQKLRAIYQRHLAQPAIVIVSSTGNMDIFDYSMRLADKWKLGKKDVDNGLLIVVAINDRKIFISTGYGLEGVIPDAIAKRIIMEDITPYFKNGDYAGGLNAGLDKLEQRLSTDPEILAQADKDKQAELQPSSAISPLGLLIIAFIVGSVLTSIFGRFLSSTITAAGAIAIGTISGMGILASLVVGGILFFLLLSRQMILPMGGGSGGGFGGSSGGGFGGSSGGYSGGGGGFGGGGAGGSW